jgi:hypothetical protein
MTKRTFASLDKIQAFCNSFRQHGRVGRQRRRNKGLLPQTYAGINFAAQWGQ